MTTFTVTTAQNTDALVRLGSVAALAWTRSTTTATVTQASHGLITNDTINVTVTSDAAAITVATKVVTVLTSSTYTFTCLNAGAASGTITASHVDNFLVNGGYLTVDQDTRYGTNQNTSAGMGNITLSSTLGGTVEFNSTLVRIIPYDAGSGNVPASNTTITGSTGSGKLIAVYSALSAAPTAAGAAMPATGFIKIKQWNSSTYANNEVLGGITATVNGTDKAGWIEIVGVDGFTATVNRLNLFKVRGDWFDLGTTDGTRATTYQIPSNGSSVVYMPGVWVETATSSGIYEFYPCAGSLTATITNMATDAVRGKFCWISTAGLVRFGHDGTNSTGGYIPTTGRKVRIPNIFFVNCTAAAQTVNVLPNATLATRYKFATTLAGVIDFDKCCMNWQTVFAQPYSVALTNVAIMTQLLVSEIASAIAWSQVGVGQEAANTQNALSMTLCVAGGTMANCTWTRASAIATSAVLMTDVTGLAITYERTCNILLRTGAATTHVLTRVGTCTWTNTTLGNGACNLSTCNDVTFTTTTFYSDPGGALQQTTASANALYVWQLFLSCVRVKFDGLDFGSLTLVQPYSGVLNIGASGNSAIKLHNIGTAASPIDMGGAQVDATYTRSTTTATVTKVAHGLKVGDIFYCIYSDSVAAIVVGSKTVLAVSSVDVFTFTCLNAGAASGAITYYPTMAAALVNIVSGHNGSDIKIQRCYAPHLRTNLSIQGDNSNKGVTFESCVGDYINAPTSISLNQYNRQLTCTHPLSVQSSVYGTHWLDQYTTGGDISTSTSWSRTTTTATVTKVGHGLRTGDFINVYTTSAITAIILGQKTITVLTSSTFTFTCLNAGASSGTIDYKPLHGRIALQMNEATTDTTAQVTLANGAAFTSAGALYMPTINHQADFTSPVNIVGHTGFPIAEAVMATATIANYDITYSMDSGVTYKNLAYTRAGGGGSNASTNVTMTSTTGVASGDYVFGTNIAPNAKVSSITDGTTVVVDIANIGVVSGVLRFNHLPSETVADASVGFPLKIRIKTTTTNAVGIPSLYFFTSNTPTSRGYTYPLDTIILTLTGLITGSDIVVLDAGTSTERINVDANSGTTYAFSYSTTGNVDIGVFKAGYVPFYIRTYPLSSSAASLPIAQVIDRNYA